MFYRCTAENYRALVSGMLFSHVLSHVLSHVQALVFPFLHCFEMDVQADGNLKLLFEFLFCAKWT